MMPSKVYDLVCVGSGAGGLTAAITAAQKGAKVLVVEKDGKLGGVTAITGGQIWAAPNPLQTQHNLHDTHEDAIAYIDFLSAGMGNKENRQTYVKRSSEALFFLQRQGLSLSIIPDFADYYYPEAPGSKQEGRYLEVTPFSTSILGPWQDRITVGQGAMTTQHGGSYFTNAELADAITEKVDLASIKANRITKNERCMGSGLVANLVHIALQNSVELRTSCKAIELIGGKDIEGIVLQGDTGVEHVKTKAVILATGAYDWSPDLVETHEFIKNMSSLTPPTITVDHFKLAAQFRAATATTLPQGCSRHVGINIPGETWGGKPFYRMMIMGLPHCIMVNQQGKRFGDESFFHTYSSSAYEFDGHTQTFPNWPAWFIFDQTYKDKYPIGPIAPSDHIPEGMATTAMTMKALAKAVGIDDHGLINTVEVFNKNADLRVDPDFHRGSKKWSHSWGDKRLPNPNLGPLTQPPFYAIKLERVGTGLASAGLKTNGNAQVIDINNEPIKGLYAVGNAAARVEMGCGYNSGMAIGRSLVFGYLSALDAFPG